MILIGKPIEKIPVNGIEYLLDGPNGNAIEFETIEDAKNFLRSKGFEERHIEGFFVYYDKETKELV